MSKKIFINNINTYVSQAILEELTKGAVDEDGEENGEAPLIFGTYIDRDETT